MKHLTKSRSAFSLIELSIVILIIGILIAGVSQSSRLVAKSRFSNARSLTQSASVASIKNLSLWIETTSEDSFLDAEVEGDATVSTWNDINPQSSLKSNFAQSTDADKPLYTLNSAGNVSSLPTLKFSSTDFMTSTNFGNILDSSSVFMVMKTPTTLTEGAPIFDKRTSGAADSTINIAVNLGSATTGWQYCDKTACHAPASGASISTGTPYVVSITYTYTPSQTNKSTAKFYKNGTIINAAVTSTTSTGPNTSATGSLMIGKADKSAPAFFGTTAAGYIGELIIFDRALKDEERKSIEGYLGKKWGISVAS